ncbi:MAG: glucoamylase family protein [Saprospiraceae bacterium]|nr:glucoamylase family protein [Saprospiraceae bacterium]
MHRFEKYCLAAGLVTSLPYLSAAQAPPGSVVAVGYDSHMEIRWTPSVDPATTAYQVFRSTDGGSNYTLLKTVGPASADRTLDWTGDEGPGVQRLYRIKAASAGGQAGAFSNTATGQTRLFTDDELLDMVQEYTFRYFWDYGHPVSGMARERSNGDGDIVTAGGSGFGIMALITGVERGWISRTQATDRMVQIVSFLQFADRYHGVFPHWMNGKNGNTIPFSQFDDGADLVETAFLMQGLLAARAYFDADTPQENGLRDAITGLWEDVEWDWFRRNNGPVLYWHWSPNFGWQMNFPLRGFYEAQIVYILAAASPTHPVPGSLYQSGWTANANYCTGATYFGYPIYCGGFGGGPLFWAHYSYLGFDPRSWKDACCNYFVRNRNHALIQWSYAKANPEKHAGYGENCWGLTACDGPNGYAAHDINPNNDDGTVAPTAALASMPYTPDQSLAALKFFYRDLGEKLWGPYGFYDAFNLNQNWFAPSYLAIDQGPISVMIENHRTGLFWDLFMQNPEIEPALLACGFVPDNSVGAGRLPQATVKAEIFPNPASAQSTLRVELDRPQDLRVVVCDANGKTVFVHNWTNLRTGPNTLPLPAQDWPSGPLFLTIHSTVNSTLKPTFSLTFLNMKP